MTFVRKKRVFNIDGIDTTGLGTFAIKMMFWSSLSSLAWSVYVELVATKNSHSKQEQNARAVLNVSFDAQESIL